VLKVELHRTVSEVGFKALSRLLYLRQFIFSHRWEQFFILCSIHLPLLQIVGYRFEMFSHDERWVVSRCLQF
jgi:hypothetical protein